MVGWAALQRSEHMHWLRSVTVEHTVIQMVFDQVVTRVGHVVGSPRVRSGTSPERRAAGTH